MKLVATVLTALALTACGGGSTDTAAPAERETTKAASPTAAASPAGPKKINEEVPWEDYAPSVRTTIDAAYAAKDCGTLQDQFDIADQNNKATLARTGHNNADLMAYIDKALAQADCY